MVRVVTRDVRDAEFGVVQRHENSFPVGAARLGHGAVDELALLVHVEVFECVLGKFSAMSWQGFVAHVGDVLFSTRLDGDATFPVCRKS